MVVCDDIEMLLIFPPCYEFQIGPIPNDDKIGKEVVTKITSSLNSNKQFFTDSNGRDFIERVCRHKLFSNADFSIFLRCF